MNLKLGISGNINLYCTILFYPYRVTCNSIRRQPERRWQGRQGFKKKNPIIYTYTISNRSRTSSILLFFGLLLFFGMMFTPDLFMFKLTKTCFLFMKLIILYRKHIEKTPLEKTNSISYVKSLRPLTTNLI
uniref:Uncharacterized protein n=1 Tax=Cacopsylla melanoneura TaxID=428564 RepID=A0A8D8U7Z1_9HEMI